MIPVYKCVWEEDEKPKCRLTDSITSWSIKNWIVFTTGCSSTTPNTDANTVYIMNPDQPWEIFPLNTDHRSLIQHIEWNHTGTKFITVDMNGVGKIWHKQHSLINAWSCNNTDIIQFSDGSPVCKVIWIDEAKHSHIDFERLGKREWFQKFHRPKPENNANTHCPNGETNSGFIVITLEGLLKVFLFRHNREPLTHTTRLGSLKSKVIMADVLQSENGKLFFALLTDPCMVELFTVSFKESANSGGIDTVVEVWPCIVPYTYGDANFENYEIKAVKCVKRTSPNAVHDKVLIHCKSSTTSSLKFFEIRKEPVKLHPRFSHQLYGSAADTSCCLGTLQLPQGTQITNVFVSSRPFSSSTALDDMMMMPLIVLTDNASGYMHTYSLLSFKPVFQPSFVETLKNDGINIGTFSSNNHALFAVSNNGNPMMFTLPISHTNNIHKKENTISLIQWNIMESHVPWDVMLSFSSADKTTIEHFMQHFVNDFMESSSGILYQLFCTSFWNVKALFYSLLKDHVGVFESYNQVFLHHVYLYIMSNLQSEKEALALDKIHNLCVSTKKEVELAKLLPVLDAKEFSFSSLSNTIHRPIIQWITDYMVHLIRLIISSNHYKQDWKYMLQYFDSSSFLYLKKLCIILFILYQKSSGQNIQPIYVTMVNSSDVLPLLFKLMSRLYICSMGETSSQGDLVIADLPFSNLPIMYMEYPVQNPRGSVLSQCLLTKALNNDFPMYYGIKQKCDDWVTVHSTATGNPMMSGILPVNTELQQIYDGINFTPSSMFPGESVKQCSRCGVLTLNSNTSNRDVNELWAVCWIENCVCGGMWKNVL